MSATIEATGSTTRTPAMMTAFRVVYAFLVLNFLLPAISYIVSPETTYGTIDSINRLLGGTALAAETGHLWHMLAVGNVMTLAFLCAMMLFDLKRFFPALPALLFLKGFSATYALFIGVANGIPFFVAVFVLDGVTTAAMWFFATRAHRLMAQGRAS
jgi:hypothetical protein